MTIESRLRAVSAGGGSQPNSKVKDLCSDGAAAIAHLTLVIKTARAELADNDVAGAELTLKHAFDR